MGHAPLFHDPRGCTREVPMYHLASRDVYERFMSLVFCVEMRGIMVIMVHPYIDTEKVGNYRHISGQIPHNPR